ncbi:hypothetical protein AYO20_04847 [Fonsecaea nubica]|uniref:Uncharacterized protein n=1 Tax=Fonsecaea nubica TaxID=856822 RepID=A0A178D432_9EURO|nr:hypothetical protein AYO20_04847 [Fonsecaea nubica]OAL35941.1 hypothetical protein AYO20_04847 [Fonsecaea nubica]
MTSQTYSNQRGLDQPDLERQGGQSRVVSVGRRWSVWFRLLAKRARNDAPTEDMNARSPDGATRPSTLRIPLKNRRTKQCCFLCMRNRDGAFAIAVPCLKPIQYGRPFATPVIFEDDAQEPDVGDAGSEEAQTESDTADETDESDAAVFERLQQECLKQQGTWKKWLPYYGITKVEEVKFEVTGVVQKDKVFSIIVNPWDLKTIEEGLDSTISMVAGVLECEDASGDICCGDEHSRYCTGLMDAGEDWKCVKDRIRDARLLKKKLRMLDLLTKCGRDPQKANGLGLLEGMAGSEWIYEFNGPYGVMDSLDDQPFDRTNEFCGLMYTVGWQMDRLKYELAPRAAWCWLVFAVVWLCVALWGGMGGHWNMPFAFGQLVVASVVLLAVPH